MYYLVQFRYNLMRNCWKVDPDERTSFEDIHVSLNHIFTDDEVISTLYQYTKYQLSVNSVM